MGDFTELDTYSFRDYIKPYARFCAAVGAAREAIKDVGRDRVFLVQHGDYQRSVYSVTDTLADATHLLIVPDDVPDKRGFAKDVIATFEEWANGDVYGAIFRTVDADGTVEYESESWGIIGEENAAEIAKNFDY